MSEHVKVEQNGAVLALTIDRAAKKNALTRAMYTALASALTGALERDDVRVVTLTGAGSIFTAGNDVGDFLAGAMNGEPPVLRFLEALTTFDKPLIAAVNGPAIGIGATLLLHCDLVFLADTATLQFPFVSLGLVPEAASSLLLPRAIGLARATELFYLGGKVSAAEAVALGLANRAVAAAALAAHTTTQAELIARQPAAALRATKRLLRRSTTATVPERLAEEAARFQERLASPEAAEAMTAFLEKRAPDFTRFA